MYVPELNKESSFIFKAPFDTLVSSSQVFKVAAIRSIGDLVTSQEDPKNTVYAVVNLTVEDYTNDYNNNVPIVVFKSTGGEHFYVPANRIVGPNDPSGYRFQEKSVLITLGHLPAEFDSTLLVEQLENTIYDIIGIKPLVSVENTSPEVCITSNEYEQFMLVTENAKSVNKSYRTRLLESENEVSNLKNLIENIEEVYIAHGLSGN